MSHNTKIMFVGFLNNGSIKLWSNLGIASQMIIDPDLHHVDLLFGKLLDLSLDFLQAINFPWNTGISR